MKLLYCNVCHEIVQLRNELRCCECGYQIGRYLPDNAQVEIASKHLGDARLVGVSNVFLSKGELANPMDVGGYFAEQMSNITTIPFKKHARDIIYGDWDDMRAEWRETAHEELFGRLTNPETVIELVKEQGPMTTAHRAEVLGHTEPHTTKILQVLTKDAYINDRNAGGSIRFVDAYVEK